MRLTATCKFKENAPFAVFGRYKTTWFCSSCSAKISYKSRELKRFWLKTAITETNNWYFCCATLWPQCCRVRGSSREVGIYSWPPRQTARDGRGERVNQIPIKSCGVRDRRWVSPQLNSGIKLDLLLMKPLNPLPHPPQCVCVCMYVWRGITVLLWAPITG